MKILRAVGLAIAIISLQFLVPRLFAGFENTLMMFFSAMQTMLGLAQFGMQTGLSAQAGSLFPLIRQ